MDISGLDVYVVTDDDVNHVVSGNFSHTCTVIIFKENVFRKLIMCDTYTSYGL